MPSEDGGILASQVENLDSRIATTVRNTLWSIFIGVMTSILVAIVGAYRRVQRVVRDTLATAGADIQNAFGSAGEAIISVNFAIRSMFIDIGLSGGVAAPIAVTTVFVLTMVVVVSVAYGVVLLIKVTPTL